MNDNGDDKLPPHSIDAEMCTLGALMLCDGDHEAWAKTAGLLQAEYFYRSDHATIFSAMLAMRKTGRPIDAVTLREFLIARNEYEKIGGLAYHGQLLNCTPSAAHGPHYAGIVRDRALGRAMLKLAEEVKRDVYHSGGTPFAEHANLHASQFATLAASGTENKIVTIGQGAMEVYERAAERKLPPLISTGFESLDREIGGFPIGGFSIIGGRPGMGKSALAKAIALTLAQAGTPVGLISVEETLNKISTNALSNLSGVNSYKIAFGRETKEDLAAMLESVNAMHHLPLFVADFPAKLSEIESTITILVHRYKCRIVFVDHVHVVDAESEAGATRAAQLVKITSELKGFAKRNNVAVVAMAQLNRGAASEGMKCRKPTLWDLKESGSLEENGDLILGLHREDYYRAQKGESERDNQMHVCILKNKLSGTGEVPLYWDGDHQRVSDWGSRVRTEQEIPA